MTDRVELSLNKHSHDAAAARELEVLLEASIESGDPPRARSRVDGVVVGTLVALRDLYEPLVVYAGQPGTAALASRTTIDVRGEHVGREVVLMFEEADPLRPIVVGLVRKPGGWSPAERPAHVEVDADDKRLIVTAKDQIVLKCGKASITLTAAGKVLIQGAYLLHRSSGVLRIKGGSVQIN
jgi:hypothetical protein